MLDIHQDKDKNRLKSRSPVRNSSSSIKHSESYINKDVVEPLIQAENLRDFICSDDKIRSHNNKHVRSFYNRQNKSIFGLIAMHQHHTSQKEINNYDIVEQYRTEQQSRTNLIVKISFALNTFLFGIKLFASVWSMSLAIIASSVDSFLDLLSGLILFLTSRAGRKRDPYNYPQGKSRLEPIGIIVFAAAMGIASLQLLTESIQFLVKGFSGSPHIPNMDQIAIVMFSLTLLIKASLFIYSKHFLNRYPDSSVVCALKNDHLNDLMTNSIGFLGSILAGYYTFLWFFDPFAALILSIIIFFGQAKTALEQIYNLIGRSATPEFIGQLTYLAAMHDKRIMRVDKVLAYHFGVRYLCEIDIVLPPDIPLRISHDIGESLEIKIEALNEVERAFVHLDYETTHKPEHKIPIY